MSTADEWEQRAKVAMDSIAHLHPGEVANIKEAGDALARENAELRGRLATARRDALLDVAVSAFGPETRTEEADGWWRVLVSQYPGVAGGGPNECAALLNALCHAEELFRALAGDAP